MIQTRKRESAQAKKIKFGLDCDVLNTYDELLERDDIDIISMCFPNFLRAEEIVKACKSEKHFFAEKPIVHTVDELKSIKSAYEKAKTGCNLITIVGFVVEYYDQFLCIKSLIEKGRRRCLADKLPPRYRGDDEHRRRRRISFLLRNERLQAGIRIRADLRFRGEIQERRDRQNGGEPRSHESLFFQHSGSRYQRFDFKR
jgi:hypothetical protein